MNRRLFIVGGTAIAAGAGLGVAFWPESRSARRGAAPLRTTVSKRPLPIPELIDVPEDDGVTLAMDTGVWEILPGQRTNTIGFNGPYLGPTLRLRDGHDAPITYLNRWREPVAIHGHGLHVPGLVDGGPQQLIEPGERWSPVLSIRQAAGTSWYHPHTHGATGSQTYQGLAGLLLIGDDNSRDLPLPKTYGLDDLPVIVQDRTLDTSGQLVYSLRDAPNEGFLGNIITANGIAGAEATVPAGLIRLRLLNGSNARFYRFRFADGRAFHKIATEGGFLPDPVLIDELVMLPGERNEIIVDLRDGRPAVLSSGPTTAGVPRGDRRSTDNDRDRDHGERRDRESNGLGDSFEVLTLTPDSSLPVPPSELPRSLTSIDRPPVGANTPRRSFRLNMEIGREQRNRDGGREAPGAHALHEAMGINGVAMDERVINERVRLGQWEVWEVSSDRRIHPFHVHGCSFLVISQDGRPVTDADAGWKDTVWVGDGRPTTFVVRFDHPASDDYPYMYHCHILEHEDMGMMGQFTVT